MVCWGSLGKTDATERQKVYVQQDLNRMTYISQATCLTHWGRVTHICVGNLTIVGSDNGLSPCRRQASFWTNAWILLIGPSWTSFSEILIGIHTFSFKKIHLKMSSAKWRPFCLGLNVLNAFCWKKISVLMFGYDLHLCLSLCILSHCLATNGKYHLGTVVFGKKTGVSIFVSRICNHIPSGIIFLSRWRFIWRLIIVLAKSIPHIRFRRN